MDIFKWYIPPALHKMAWSASAGKCLHSLKKEPGDKLSQNLMWDC